MGKRVKIGKPYRGVAVAFDPVVGAAAAEMLARRLGLSVAKKFRDPHLLHLALVPDAVATESFGGMPGAESGGASGGGSGGVTVRLELRVNDPGHPLAGGRGMAGDLLKLDTSSPAGRSRKSPLLRAVGLGRSRKTLSNTRGEEPSQAPPPLRVLDVTAGLGEDTWLLAAAGCEVTAVERQPVVHALLADALARAAAARPDIAGRIELLPVSDAADVLKHLIDSDPYAPGHDVVLIDPMFPDAASRKTTQRKPLRLLRLLAGDDPDAGDLWPLAMAAARRRVVVKRPLRAPHLVAHPPHPAPAATHAGRGFRFDVYPVHRDPGRESPKPAS